MELTATVHFYGDPAHYTVTEEREGIYNARLMVYEGPNIMAPPDNVILVRSVRKWTGSYGEQDFIEELGRAIDLRQRNSSDPNT
jgi:hypothetical protein